MLRGTPGQMSNILSPQNTEPTNNAQNDGRSFLDPVAIATLAVAMVTGFLAFATYRAAVDTRRALYLAQRPKLRIRNVVVRPVARFGYDPTLFLPEAFVSGQFYIVNVGGTAAQLIEAHSEVYWTTPGVHSLPMERPYEGSNPNAPNLTMRLQPGESTPLTFSSDKLLGERESDQITQDGALSIYVLGFVAYKDALGIARRTAFCRKYDYARRRFFAVDDPDYEHEE